MMIRGGGDPRQAWLRRRPREWACPPELRHRCASLHHGRGSHGPAEYKGVARVRVRDRELPSDREIRLDRTKPHTSLPRRRPGALPAPSRPETPASAGAGFVAPSSPLLAGVTPWPRQSFPVAASICPRFHDVDGPPLSTTQNGAYFSVCLGVRGFVRLSVVQPLALGPAQQRFGAIRVIKPSTVRWLYLKSASAR